MQAPLLIHPASPGRPAVTVAVEAERVKADTLLLTYKVRGEVSALALPHAAAPARVDELWRHTCFEVFALVRDGRSYYEFNLAPSSQWAAYGFSGYREGMGMLDTPAPKIALSLAGDALTLRALVTLPADTGDRFALSAVIETMDGGLSYWALAHASDKPDFHHPNSFVLTLEPAELA